MRILLLAQFFPPDIGGEEQHVFNLANTLADRGHGVAVATQQVAGVPDEEVLPSGVRVHRFATMAMRLPGVSRIPSGSVSWPGSSGGSARTLSTLITGPSTVRWRCDGTPLRGRILGSC